MNMLPSAFREEDDHARDIDAKCHLLPDHDCVGSGRGGTAGAGAGDMPTDRRRLPRGRFHAGRCAKRRGTPGRLCQAHHARWRAAASSQQSATADRCEIDRGVQSFESEFRPGKRTPGKCTAGRNYCAEFAACSRGRSDPYMPGTGVTPRTWEGCPRPLNTGRSSQL
jgi:hypothetical protein